MNLQARLDRVLPLVRQASELALNHFGKVEGREKSDRTVVSKADEEVERLLVEGLQRRFPGETIVGEEGGATGPLQGPVWSVDPIDGTSAYLTRLPHWGVSVGLLVEGRPVLGIVDLPLLGETYLAVTGRGAWMQTDRWGRQALQVRPWSEPGPESMFCVPSNLHRRYGVRFPGKLRSLGSTVAHVLLVARGDACAALMRVHLWDLAGCAAILTEAGGRLETLDAGPLNLLELLPGAAPLPDVLASSPTGLAEMRTWVWSLAQGS